MSETHLGEAGRIETGRRNGQGRRGVPGDPAKLKELLAALSAAREGDFAVRLPFTRGSGVLAEIARAFNAVVARNESLVNELVRLEGVVGREGRMTERASLGDVQGGWTKSVQSVNALIGDLVQPTTEVARVLVAVAEGDLTQKMALEIEGQPVKGEFLRIGTTVNSLVDQLNSFAGEVTRVAREVVTAGRLGGQAEVRGVSGIWKDLTDNVNILADNLTDQVRNIAKVTTAVANGDLSQQITVEAKGEVLALKNTINTMVDQLRSFASEVTRVAREVGTEGRLGGQADVRGVSGVWKDLTDNVNFMAANLTGQVRNIALVTTAVANGDLSRKITVDVKGEILELKNTINTMVDQLNSFASEVTRVAKEVGTEGKLGGQAEVQGVAGVWKNLTDNVNFMARNLTTQVRGISKVVTAVANGDLAQKLLVDAKGEVAALAETINAMTETLRTFADQVSTVAREVGIEGKLGGQAKVPNATGTWRQLTDNVNQLAASLTTQIRAISEVATAVTKGDLTRSITVGAEGEVAKLKDNINQMIVNLRETTQKNTEQDWLKTNLAKFSSMMQGQKNLDAVSQLIMSQLTPLVSAQHGAFFVLQQNGSPLLKLAATYAYRERKSVSSRFKLGEGLLGQCALEKKPILITKAPPDYIRITSGLGEAPPLNILALPVLYEGQVKAVIELASFNTFSAIHQIFLDQLMESIGVVLNMIEANMRTEELLEQSQGLTQQLQTGSQELTVQQEELKRTNAALEKQALELEEKAKQLVKQNADIEVKNREVEMARASLEEKAEQLSLISKYKSEFLANMSHELRTPLNSLLILAKLLVDNKEKNLTEKQVEFAKTIYTSGGDLLVLINEILDLSKVEAGKMQVEPRDIALLDLAEYVERNFRTLAEQKGLEFEIQLAAGLPRHVTTDPQRLQQVLKNLLANAVKFTEQGGVKLRIEPVHDRAKLEQEGLKTAPRVIAFSVIDTGIGIPKSRHRIIFEAFQQADGTTSRKYGGTGLGLSISREIARLLGGEIQVESAPGVGSTFTLFLPERYLAPEHEHPAEEPAARVSPLPKLSVARDGEPELGLLSQPRPVRVEAPKAIEDDREHLREGDRVLLIIEDDVKFARIMVGLAREKGFRAVVATRGDLGLSLANELVPAAITLDLQLPVMDGWAVLDKLKRNPRTRHIPVHVISVLERSRKAAAIGAFACLEKPVSREALEGAFSHILSFVDKKVKRLLLIEDDPTQQRSIAELLGEGEGVEVISVGSGEEALAILEKGDFDCVVLDLILGDADGGKLLEQIKTQSRFRDLPVIVYTVKDLTPKEEAQLKKYAESVILKTGSASPEKLLSDTALFLHRIDDRLPARARKLLPDGRDDDSLAGRKILIVDDDVRNVFAMTSVLESHGLDVLFAENGRDGMEVLERHPDVDVVLMDVMMPKMDGYETMRAIRKDPAFQKLPIVAVTAKALKEDREKCMAAGASDYVPKPVDTEKLLELIRLWVR